MVRLVGAQWPNAGHLAPFPRAFFSMVAFVLSSRWAKKKREREKKGENNLLWSCLCPGHTPFARLQSGSLLILARLAQAQAQVGECSIFGSHSKAVLYSRAPITKQLIGAPVARPEAPNSKTRSRAKSS